MCGIAGIFSYADHALPVDREELLRMREQMIARGPDGAGLWVSPDQRVGLAHRRLAIIDLTTDGAQPMTTDDGRYHIVYNGEIYNYRELRSELQGQGTVFKSHSDTEVLLHLYQRDGTAMCWQLRGMYAFAIWDTHERSIFLARDPFGIKPLYVHDNGKTLRFASQVKALLAGGAILRQPDSEAERDYWIWGHVPEPRTYIKNIKAMGAGTWKKVNSNGQNKSAFFESVGSLLGLKKKYENSGSQHLAFTKRNDWTLRDALLDTVHKHLIADVPVGIFLSAGIDSATLVALAAECGSELRTVTLGFEEYRGTPADETILAEQVAKQYGALHQTVWITRADFQNAFEEFIACMDQPSIDGLNTWLVARTAAKLGLKVAISGLGGDELFGGYPSFRQIPKIRRLARPFATLSNLPKVIRKLSAPILRGFTSEKYAGLLEYGSSLEGAYMLRRALRMPWELDNSSVQGRKPEVRPQKHSKSLWPSSRRDDCSDPFKEFAQISHLEITRYMRNQLLRDSDWAGMAHGIELRVPLVDTELTRFVASQRLKGKRYTKQDLAAVANPPLPETIRNRPKTGFTVPVRDWMQSENQTQTLQAKRGLRGWQDAVLHAWQKGCKSSRSSSHGDS